MPVCLPCKSEKIANFGATLCLLVEIYCVDDALA